MSSTLENEETVDSFGRTIKPRDEISEGRREPRRDLEEQPSREIIERTEETQVRGERESGGGRGGYRDNQSGRGNYQRRDDNRGGGGRHGGYGRNQGQHADRDWGRDQDRDRDRGNNDSQYYPRQQVNHHEHGSRGHDEYYGGRGRGPPPRRFEDECPYNRSRFSPLVVFNPAAIPVHRRISPLVSFKTFMQSQRDDLSPEEFQRIYDEYNVKYIEDFCDEFFHTSKAEPWFQDRYNPVRRQEIEAEAAAWSVLESAKFKTDLETNTSLVVQGVCLDKSAIPTSPPKREKDQAQLVRHRPMDESNPADIPGRHFSGHEYRMLFVSGLHASCTLSALKTAFTTAINSKGLTITPERVVLSQPMWTTKGSPSRYERKGWIILPTVESLQSVREAMTELRISIPGPVDSVTGAPSVLFEFTAPLTQHTIRLPPHMLPEHLSSSHRIAVDTYKARELAELFDTDRNIPIDSRLSAILSSPTVEQACTKSSDKLDIAIAYLRRVHFFVFYGGRFYQNEAHLLSLSAGCSYRSGALATQSSKGTIVSVAESTGAEATIEESKKEVTVTGEDEEGEEEDDEEYGRDKYEEDDEDADESRSRKRRLESEDNETTPVELTAVTTTDPSTMRVTDEPSDYVKRGHTDKRVEIMIRELRAKVAHSHALLEQRNKKEAAGVDTATNVDSEVEPTIENDGDAQASKALESGQRHEVVHLTRDEQDVQTLQALNDQALFDAVEVACLQAQEGKVRCWFKYCNKLFKDVAFLKKHVTLKHEEYCQEVTLHNTERFMRARYDAEDYLTRPLPPVEVEVQGGTELRSVLEILRKHGPKQLTNFGPFRVDQGRGRNLRDHFEDRGGSGGGRGGGGGRGSRDGRRSFDHSREKEFAPQPPRGPPPDFQTSGFNSGSAESAAPQRKISTYMDVDAPKATVAEIDYGVSILPPAKKRKSLKK